MSPRVPSPGNTGTNGDASTAAVRNAAVARPIPASVWRLAAVVTFGAFMSGLDTSLVNMGLQRIGKDLGSSLASAQWITSGYLLALAAALPASGWLSERFGSGRLWLWALGGFTAASGFCAVAPTISLLVCARALQGMAGGLLVTAGITILAHAAGKEYMGRILAITGVPTVLAPALGPTVGALLLAHFSWQWLFVINLPIGVVGLFLGRRAVPRGDKKLTNPLDWLGLLLVAAGLPLFSYGITQVAQLNNLAAPVVFVPLVGGVIALTVFVFWSLRRPFPLLDLRVFTNRVFAAAATQVVFGGAALFGGQIVMPLYFQIQRQASIINSGLLLLPFGLAAAATFPLGGSLTDRYGGGRVAAFGLALTAAVTIPLALLPPNANLMVVEALQIPRGIGLALAGAPVIAAAMATVERHQLADASAQISILSRVGGALGSALLVVILTNQLPHGTSGLATAAAFHSTFWWLALTSIAALGSAGWLAIEQHRPTPLTSEP